MIPNILDLDLVELHTLYAALLNPQCHYDLANDNPYIAPTDSLEYWVEIAYLEFIIERKVGK